MENQAVYYIEVTVGELPEWYEESEHDYALERAIEKHLQNTHADADTDVIFAYSGPHIAKAYDDDGNVVFEQEIDLAFAFETARNA